MPRGDKANDAYCWLVIDLHSGPKHPMGKWEDLVPTRDVRGSAGVSTAHLT
jgi:hypothetical protein